MVLDKAKPKYKDIGMRGRHAVRKSTPKVNILHIFTIDLTEIQFMVNHNSQTDGQNKCKEWDELEKDHTNKLTPEEKRRYKRKMVSYCERKSVKNAPTKLRSDFRAAFIMKIRLHHEPREPMKEPIHPGQHRRQQQGQKVFSEDYFSSARIDQHTGWQYSPSSPSSSWWHETERSWK